jgi:molybdopterin converting factor small subunit
MITVEFYGLYRLEYKMANCELEADNILELLEVLAKSYPVYTVKELKNSVIMVNEVNFLKLNKFKTKLNSGDKVFIMSPASGG